MLLCQPGEPNSNSVRSLQMRICSIGFLAARPEATPSHLAVIGPDIPILS